MSGVGEALAIVSCVAGLIQAYDAAARRIEKIKKRREQREAPPPSIHLETSVERGKQQIVEVVKEGKELFGEDFERGDEEVQIALMKITIATQAELLEGLAAGREDDDSVDFSGCIDASDTGRRQALVVLNEYIMRKTREERAKAATRTPDAPANPTMPASMSQVQQVGQSLQGLQQENTMPMPPQKQVPAPPANDSQRPKRFSFRRSAPTAAEPRQPQTTRPAPVPVQSHDVSLSPIRARTTSGSIQASNDSGRATGRRTSSPQRQPTSSINTQLYRSPVGTNNVPSPGSSPRSASISESSIGSPTITTYGGCCKYAHYLRDGKVGQSLQRQNLAMYGATNCNFRCQSTKCTFQIPAIRNQKKEWIIDSKPRVWRRTLQYTPIFLAKSHVPIRAPLVEQTTKAQYRCIICMLSLERTNVFHGHDALLEHVVGHTGASWNGVRLEGPLSFSNDGIGLSGEFDLNLPESESPPTVVQDTSIATHVGQPVLDAEIQHELEKLGMSSRRSSSATQDTDPYHNPWLKLPT